MHRKMKLSIAFASLILTACTPVSVTPAPKGPTSLTLAESLANPRDARSFRGIEDEPRSRLQNATLTLGSLLHSLSSEIDQLEFRAAPIMPTALSPEYGLTPTTSEFLDNWVASATFKLDPRKIRNLWVHATFKDGSELQLIATDLRTDSDFNDAAVQELFQRHAKRVVKLASHFKKFPVLNDQGKLEVLPLTPSEGRWIQVFRTTLPGEVLSDLFETSVLQHGYLLEDKVFYGVTAP